MRKYLQPYREALDWAMPPKAGWKAVERALMRWRAADGVEQYMLLNKPLLDVAEPSEKVWPKICQALNQQSNRAEADALECFIQAHRTDFDEAVPPIPTWDAIAHTLAGGANNATITPAPALKVVRTTNTWRQSLLRAAAAIALLLTGLAAGIWYGRGGNEALVAQRQGVELRQVSNEYAELQDFYERDIATKQKRLAQFAGQRDQELMSDLGQMDTVMAELKQELANVPVGSREKVVRAMIENYKAKAAVLSRVLDQLETHEKEDDHRSDTERM